MGRCPGEAAAAGGRPWDTAVVETAPSGYGCHRGPPLDKIQEILRTDRRVIKGFSTEAEANQRARKERDFGQDSCYFEDWSHDFYEEAQPPSYDSRDVLSIPYARLSPEDVEGLARFTHLRKLALSGSFDMEWGDMGFDSWGRGGYSSDEYEQETEKPFCQPLLQSTAVMKRLQVLDITGHMDYGCFARILTYGTIEQIARRGVQVELGVQEHW